ncbi:hypothetical protein ACFQ1L_04280 [Phytohabitans flavus]|uniref:hypothetical protein n=1 Tax=Phytohabitans flavus TaxID=1076124 RepID=UPI0036376D45
MAAGRRGQHRHLQSVRGAGRPWRPPFERLVPEVAPTSGWTPSSAPTSGWVGSASTSEWTREAYTGEWTRGDFTGEWHRDTGEPITPSRSDSARRGEPGGGRRRAAPDRRELPEEPSGYGRRSAVPPPRDSFTDTTEWVPPRGDQAGDSQSSRPRRPDWAVGQDTSVTGRRRRSWQDQTEARWPGTRSEGDRTEEPSGSWSSSAPVSGLTGTSDWSGRAETSRSEEPPVRPSDTRGQQSDPRLSEDDPRWVGIPSSAPRSPAVAFPDEPDDRSATRGTSTTLPADDLRGADRTVTYGGGDWVAPQDPPSTYRGDDRRGAGNAPATSGDDSPTTYRSAAAPRARAEAPATDWRAPAAAPGERRAAPGVERGIAEAPSRAAAPAADWRAPAPVAGSERAAAPASGRAAASAAGWRSSAAGAGRERGLGAAVRRVTNPDDLEDSYSRAPGGVFGAVVATLAWYAVPLLFFTVYTLFQGEKSQVLGALSGGLTRFGAALAVSLIVAVLLRWVSNTWRSVSVGLAAAVVGGGLSTVLLSAISGQPLGG